MQDLQQGPDGKPVVVTGDITNCAHQNTEIQKRHRPTNLD
jgi:hypothetical protein